MGLLEPPTLLWLHLLACVLTAPLAGRERERGGQNVLALSRDHATKRNSSAVVAGYGELGTQICGMYSADFAVNGSGVNACKRWPVKNLFTHFESFGKGNLDKARCEMPQIPSAFEENHTRFDRWKAAEAEEGVLVAETNATAGALGKLMPTQRFVNRCQACSIAYSGNTCFTGNAPLDKVCGGEKPGCFCFWSSGMSITEDGYVLDGHHRWAAAKIMLADGILPEKTQAVLEKYTGAEDKPKATLARIVATANRHPTLVKHTKCSAEEQAEALLLAMGVEVKR